jgi:hypothetical protein
LTAAAKTLVDLYYDAKTTGKYAFNASAWKPAKGQLKKESGGKCAYCEAPTDVVAHGDVEHFRPKSTYWWLAFCYDNYLFSCQICNQTYKGDNFPVSGTVATPPPMPLVKPTGAALDLLAASLVLDATLKTDADVIALWAAEDADLPNPYLENPEPLLAYEVDAANEEVWVRSTGGGRADRAIKAAEDLLGINREELRRERYVNFLTLAAFKAILDAGPSLTIRQLAEREVRRMQAAKEPFAGMRRYFATQWGLPGPV